MTTDTDAGGDADPMQDAEAWKDLSREEQSDLLDEGLQDLKGESDGDAWRHLSDTEQAETISAIERDGGRPPEELSDTERAMQEALQETWTVEIFADLEDVPTVPFECRELDAKEQSKLMEAGQAVLQVEQSLGDLDDVDEDDLDDAEFGGIDLDLEHFDSADDLNEWIPRFLASVTEDAAFDAERFRTGERMRTNTRRLLFIEIFLRYQEEVDRAIKFRTESGG